MYLLLFMQLEEDHTDTMKGDISWDLHTNGRTYKLDKTWKLKLAVGNDNHLWQPQLHVCKYYSPNAGRSAVNKIIVTCSGTVTSKWYIQRKLKWYK
jgi:hypothetical protein